MPKLQQIVAVASIATRRKRKRARVHILIAIVSIVLAGCLNEESIMPVPVPAGGGSMSSGSSGAQTAPTPMAPAVPNANAIEDNSYNIPGVREVHAVQSAQNCRQMAERFKREGRNIRLTAIRSLGKGDLPIRCIFEGPDAEANYWEDRRYQKPENGGF